MNKENLDNILTKYKVQPVGDGYIDLIVKRENYKEFIEEVLLNGFEVKSISWWEWCSPEEKPKFGLGGPNSEFYIGWFAELPIELDEVSLEDGQLNQPDELFSFIESKSIVFPEGKITFKNAEWLTPALWLNVPGDWRNKQCIIPYKNDV